MSKNSKTFQSLAVCALVAAAFFSILWPHLSTMLNDPGLGWHLKAGQLMSQTFSPLYEDPFLAYEEPQKWVHDQWLSDIILYYLYQQGGWSFLVASMLPLFLFIFFPFVFSGCIRDTGSLIFSGLAVFTCMKLVTLHVVVRPVAMSLLIFSIFLWLLWKLKGEAIQQKPLSRKLLVVLILLFALWANLHPYFSLGLLVFAGALTGLLFDQYALGRVELTRRTWAVLWGTFFLCLLATFCNPYTYQLHLQVFQLSFDPFYSSLHTEWRPIDFTRPEGQLLQVALGVVFFAAVLSQSFRERYGFAYLVPFLGLLHLALGSVRGVPVLAIFMAPLMASGLQCLCRLEWFKRFGLVKSRPDRALSKSHFTWITRSGFLASLLLGLLLCFASFSTHLERALSEEIMPSKEFFPWEALPLLNELSAERSITVYTSPDYGGFLTLHTYPEARAVLDDRNTLHSKEAYKDFLNMQVCKKSILDVTAASQSSVVLFPADSCVWRLQENLQAGRVVKRGEWKALILDPDL